MLAIEWLPDIILWVSDSFIFWSIVSYLFLISSQHYSCSVFILEKILRKQECPHDHLVILEPHNNGLLC